ncbi:MAG TPA: serine hydrolase domain-containing protein, partial [Candidatus Limnocylindrales bacterium]
MAKLQARLDAIRAKYRLPGVSATIIWPDGRVWTGASGYANVGHRVKVVAGTAFSIGSVSKTFMATLVLELVQEGKLGLDDRVRHWLPAANVSTHVTVRELLDHTSGLY